MIRTHKLAYIKTNNCGRTVSRHLELRTNDSATTSLIFYNLRLWTGLLTNRQHDFDWFTQTDTLQRNYFHPHSFSYTPPNVNVYKTWAYENEWKLNPRWKSTSNKEIDQANIVQIVMSDFLENHSHWFMEMMKIDKVVDLDKEYIRETK